MALSRENILQRRDELFSKAKDFVRPVRKRARKPLEIARMAYQKFEEDQGAIRSSAIAYSLALAIVPLITVLVTFGTVDLETIRFYLARFMTAYGITDPTEVLRIYDEITRRATAIAVSGAVFAIFTVANAFRLIEDSFHHIYRNLKPRPIVIRFSLYIASLIVFPASLIILGGVGNIVLSWIRPPNLTWLAQADGFVWIAGDQGIIKQLRGDDIKEIPFAERLTHEIPFREVIVDAESYNVGHSWERGQQDLKLRLEQKDINSLKRVIPGKSLLHAISESGTYFYSEDGGNSWLYDIFGFQIESKMRKPIFEDIIVFEDDTIWVLATTGNVSWILAKEQGYWSVKSSLKFVFHRFDRSLITYEDETISEEITLMGTGRILTTNDRGQTWSDVIEEKFGPRSVPIYALQRIGPGFRFLGGSTGALWIHDGGATTFPPIRANSNQHVMGIRIFPDGKGYLYGANGLFRYTFDEGKTWHRVDSSIIESNTFLSDLQLPDGSILLAGENNILIRLSTPKKSADLDEDGYPFVEFKVHSITANPLWKILFMRILFSTMVFIGTFAVVTFAYLIIPGTKVEWHAAITGGLVSSASLLVFVVGFREWSTSFSATGAIYGVWAVIPVGMLLLLAGIRILLFGLQLAYVIQHQEKFRTEEILVGERGKKQPTKAKKKK